MATRTPNVDAATDEDGYLINPGDWNEETAEILATQEELTLTEDHWSIIRFVREWHAEHGVAPSSRDAILFMKKKGESRNRLFELFPYGYVQQTCKIAGMKRPRAWSTG